MAEPRTYAPGTPSWVDCGAPDTGRAAQFYQGLFGWDAVFQPGPVEETGGYAMFQLDGKDVAGLGPGQRPSWTTYVAVANADDTAKAVEENGGSVVMAPLSIMQAGRMAVLTDAVGAVFSIWQAGEHTGFHVTDEPNTYCWCELACRDIEGAKTFYRAVFGWQAETTPFGEGSTYTQFSLPGATDPHAGMVEMNEMWPDDVPSHWMVYFQVADTDATAARATELGGVVSVEPFDIPDVGRIAVLNDDQGAVFSVLQRP